MSSGQEQRLEVASLKRRLEEATDTLRAIRQGEVDAVVVQGADGNQVYTLQTADHPYRVLVQQMNEGAVMLSREGFILHANPRLSGLVMALPEELNAGAIQQWIVPEDRVRFERALTLTFEGQPQRVELTLLPRQADAAPVPVVVSLAPLNLTTMDGVCAVVTDLRERRHRESLERGELMARSLMDHATAAVVITDREGRIERANAAAMALAGRPAILQPFESIFPLVFDGSASSGEPKQSVDQLIRLATEGASLRGMQARMEGADAQTVELQVSAGPFGPSADEITGAVFTLADVTALRTSERRFRDLAESIPQIVWVADASGRLEYLNTVGADYFGMTVDELGQAIERAVHPDDSARFHELWNRALQTGMPFQAECRLKSRRGEARWFLMRAVPIRDLRGQITQWFGTSTDVDAQKGIENDLRSANADLEHFAYAASHDFQEPLRMVTAYAQLLEKEFGGKLEGAGAMSLKYVLEGTDRLGALLQNLLSYMRASRDPEGAMEEIDCNEVLREVLANLQIPIQQSGALIRSAKLPRVSFPRIHMLELLQNLVNNAIKYRGASVPEIQISAHRKNGDWIFTVEDNGIGIAPQHQQNIFGVFKRLHGNNIPGTGIGLAICRRLVEQHHGRIWVESQVNRGSIFYFSLPAAVKEHKNGSAHA
jgi:PAS domain S-box-containing protein